MRTCLLALSALAALAAGQGLPPSRATAAELATCASTPRSALRAFFDTFIDLNHDGAAGPIELFTMIQSFATHSGGEHERRQLHELPADARRQFDTWFASLDAERADGVLAWSEFCRGFARLHATSLRPDGAVEGADNAAGQLHLSVTSNVGEMQIMWVTGDDYAPGTAFAEFWPTGPGQPSKTVAGNSLTYTVPSRWWDPTGSAEGYMHRAVMTGLTPGAAVPYRVGGYNASDPSSPVTSDVFTFTVASAPAPQTQTRVFMYGDQGTFMPLGFAVTDSMIEDVFSPAANSTVPWAGQVPDAILHVGDISYAGIDTEISILNISKADEWELIWNLFAQQMMPLTSVIPYMTGVGNHESFYNFTAFMNRYYMPGNATGGNGNFWFSFNLGNIHFTCLSSEHDYTIGSPQWLWARQDLARANANRAKTPWIVVGFHRPMYCSDQDEWTAHSPGCPLQVNLEPLLAQFKVDVVITGHMHVYERTHPVVNGTVTNLPSGSIPTPSGGPAADVYTNPSAPIHLTVGSAGAMQADSWVSPIPAWSAARALDWFNSYGYGALTAFNATHLNFRFRPLTEAPGAVPSTADSFWIIRQ